MPARTVYFVPNSIYHIYNRGSEKRTIFRHPRDYYKFIGKLKKYTQLLNIDVLAYCLMPNHFHLLLKQLADISIHRFMQRIEGGHAKFFNTKYDRVGPLFQGRFKAKIVETDEYLLQAHAYIHKNPIADMVIHKNTREKAMYILNSYPYSSYQDYLHPAEKSFVARQQVLEYFSRSNPKFTYQSFVENFVLDTETTSPFLAHP